MTTSGDSDNPLRGTWHLVRWDISYGDGRPASLPFGADATGLITYTDDGTMNACISRNPRSRLSSDSVRSAPEAERLAANARVTLETTPTLADWVAERCTVEETGARNVDQVIAGQILPRISTEILSRMAKDEPVGTVKADVGEDGALTITFA